MLFHSLKVYFWCVVQCSGFSAREADRKRKICYPKLLTSNFFSKYLFSSRTPIDFKYYLLKFLGG